MSEQGTSFEARIVLHPRSLDETFDLALAYARSHARDLWRVALVSVLAVFVPCLALGFGLGLDDGAVFALGVLLTTLFERTTTIFVGRHVFGNTTSTRSAWAAFARRFGGLGFVALAVTLPGLMLVWSEGDNEGLLGFGVMLGVFWPFLVASGMHLSEVSLLEQLPLGKSLKRARALGAYRYGRAMGLLLVGLGVRALFVYGAYAVGVFLFSFLLQVRGFADNFDFWLALLGYALSGPYVALVRFLDYIDARTRREGWDIQVRFNAIAQRTRAERARRMAA